MFLFSVGKNWIYPVRRFCHVESPGSSSSGATSIRKTRSNGMDFRIRKRLCVCRPLRHPTECRRTASLAYGVVCDCARVTIQRRPPSRVDAVGRLHGACHKRSSKEFQFCIVVQSRLIHQAISGQCIAEMINVKNDQSSASCTFSARGPFGPWPTVYVTVWPSWRSL